MKADLEDLNLFLAIVRWSGFREASRRSGVSSSKLSEAVRRLEASLGVRLLHRSTRSVSPTEAGSRLVEELVPAFGAVEQALEMVNGFRDRPAGTLRLNVPVSAARLILPAILPGFLLSYPDIQVEIIGEDTFVDVVGAGYDAGIRYDDRLEQDMIAVPIGPRVQRLVTVAAPAYLARRGRPVHPRDLLQHLCLRGRFSSGALAPWEFERNGELVRIETRGPLIVRVNSTIDLAIDVAVAGGGVVHLFEDWLRPHLETGALEPVLEDWWQSFSGPFLYYSGRRLLPPPLRAFIDFVKSANGGSRSERAAE